MEAHYVFIISRITLLDLRIADLYYTSGRHTLLPEELILQNLKKIRTFKVTLISISKYENPVAMGNAHDI